MKRTTAPNNQSNLYVDQTGSVPGTSLVAEDRNLIQEEICNFLEGFGITLNGSSDEQIKDLMQDYLDQKLKTTDDVVFDQITANGAVDCNSTLEVNGNEKPTTTPTYGEWTLSNTSIIIPRGKYVVSLAVGGGTYSEVAFINSSTKFPVFSGFNTSGYGSNGGTILSDGLTTRIYSTGLTTTRYLKF